MRVELVLTAIAIAGVVGCGDPPPPPRFPVTFNAVSDPGVPLGGVQLTANRQPIGVTAADGSLHVDLTGPEGSPVEIGATCPSGYRTPTDLPTITLRQVVSLDPAAASRGLQVGIACPPTHRHGVVVIRAGGDTPQPNLPVMIDGRQVALTDASGVAHVALDMQPGSTFQVLLATAAVPGLRPQDPRMNFTFPDGDDIFIFDQSFDVERPRSAPRRRRQEEAAPTWTPPVRITSVGRR
jgi:hypothetical protein